MVGILLSFIFITMRKYNILCFVFQNLEKTCEKLYSTKKQKEQVEKAICRQLHKTHTILRQAKHNLENPNCGQQENVVPLAST